MQRLLPWRRARAARGTVGRTLAIATLIAATCCVAGCDEPPPTPWRIVHSHTRGKTLGYHPSAALHHRRSSARIADGATPTAAPLPLGATALEERAKHPFADPMTELAMPATLSDDIYPCTDCHEPDDVDLNPRKLEDEHETIRLNHGPAERWCWDCHHPTQRDRLRLASGETVPFTQSHRLCGQCHGRQLRLWRIGVHGKRTGHWNGAKKGLTCVNCHRPHSPLFRPQKPKPIPKRPSEIRPAGAARVEVHP